MGDERAGFESGLVPPCSLELCLTIIMFVWHNFYLMNFYDRAQEIKRLKKSFSSAQPKLVVVYGRRRCGKSTLLKRVLSEHDFYYVAPQADEAIQRVQLAQVIGEQIPGFDRVVYPDWESLFTNLNNNLTRSTTLCLDEFPYLVKSSGSLPSVIQKLMDRPERQKFHLALCGSSQQMMRGIVLDSSAPLYGRANEILKIIPLEAGWLMDHLAGSPEQAVIEYATWGGVPRYWELRKEYVSYEEAVKDAVLSRLGVLHEEPARLFLDDMRESIQAYSVMAIVGNGGNKLSEIAGRLQKPATHLSRLLDKMIQLGYLARETPFGASLKNNKKSLYKVADPFMNFYFSFVAPNLSRLELGLVDQVFESVSQKLNHFVAKEWENLCRRCIPMLPIEGISFDQAFRWWGVNARGDSMELDVAANDLDKKFLLVGECKWTSVRNPDHLLQQLVEKARLIPGVRAQQEIIPMIFTRALEEPPHAKVQVFTPADVLGRLR